MFCRIILALCNTVMAAMLATMCLPVSVRAFAPKFVRAGDARTIIRGISGSQTLNMIMKEPPFPSIDAMAKQMQLQKLMKEYQNSGKKSIIEDTVEFPTVFIMKVIGVNDATFAIDTINAIAFVLGETPEKIDFNIKETSGGKYISITISPVFSRADEVYAAYEAVSKDSRVKFVM
jgi:putative lipoic acid-binding regulatory protein